MSQRRRAAIAAQAQAHASSSRNPYARAIGGAAALLTLAGIGIGLFVYARWTPDAQPGQGGDEWAAGGGGGSSRAGGQARWKPGQAGADEPSSAARGTTGGAASTSTRRAPPDPHRPTLSLSLPPSFDRSSAQALQRLHDLVAHLSPHFVVHLIVPIGPFSESSGLSESTAEATETSPASSSAPGLAGTAGTGTGTGALAALFADVLDFDTRRILLYSTSTGRQAISAALACDAHVQVSFVPPHGAGRDQDARVDEMAEDEAVAESIKRVEHLQRAAGVVVLLVIPSPSDTSATGAPSRLAPESTLTATLEHFKKASFSRSVRIVDTTSSLSPEAGSAGPGTVDVSAQWEAGAERIVELRAKMKR